MAARLDLREDFGEIYAYLVERVRNFDPETNDGPDGPGPITRIDFGYGFEQDGWVTLVFDTRPDPEPDGEWTMHIEGNDLRRPKWLAAHDANEAEPLTLVRPDGSERELPPGSCDALAAAIGDLLKGVLFKARAEGVLAGLPKAPRCEMGIEETDGGLGWPPYEERGRENLA